MLLILIPFISFIFLIDHSIELNQKEGVYLGIEFILFSAKSVSKFEGGSYYAIAAP